MKRRFDKKKNCPTAPPPIQAIIKKVARSKRTTLSASKMWLQTEFESAKSWRDNTTRYTQQTLSTLSRDKEYIQTSLQQAQIRNQVGANLARSLEKCFIPNPCTCSKNTESAQLHRTCVILQSIVCTAHFQSGLPIFFRDQIHLIVENTNTCEHPDYTYSLRLLQGLHQEVIKVFLRRTRIWFNIEHIISWSRSKFWIHHKRHLLVIRPIPKIEHFVGSLSGFVLLLQIFKFGAY